MSGTYIDAAGKYETRRQENLADLRHGSDADRTATANASSFPLTPEGTSLKHAATTAARPKL
jgi:hypothetical protein